MAQVAEQAVKNTESIAPKPILKWAGGKTQLLGELLPKVPSSYNRYIEPFVGGGAMFFALQPENGLIADSNPELINMYRQVSDNVEAVIRQLETYQNTKDMFYLVRGLDWEAMTPSEAAARTIYLNKTCFNGLYRVNKKGLFNVPFGKYANPTICNAEVLRADSQLLQSAKVEICQGDYTQTLEHVDGLTFFYLDPPYRPLDATSSFTAYAKGDFNDDDQRELADFCHQLSDRGCLWMESNADCSAKNPEDTFFEDLYRNYRIERVYASRFINANPNKRGKLTELLIKNYE